MINHTSCKIKIKNKKFRISVIRVNNSKKEQISVTNSENN